MNSPIHIMKSMFVTVSVPAMTFCFGLALANIASAQDAVSAPSDLVPYSQDFDAIPTGENSDSAGPSTLYAADPWAVFGNAFDGNLLGPDGPLDGAFLFGYGPFFAPNLPDADGAAFSNVAAGEPTTSGDNYLNIFNDYNNAFHGDGSGNLVNALVFQQRNVGPENVGQVWVFEFDFRSAPAPFGIADNVGSQNFASTGAFVTVLESSTNSFFTIDRFTLDTTNATTGFQRGSIEIEITDAHVGELLQFGFESSANNFAPTGVLYDTLSFAIASDSIVGDFDDDGDVDCDDIDSIDEDLTADGNIDGADVEFLIETLVETTNGQVGTFLGDLNCDGSVDVLGDAFTLIGNLGTAVSSYTDGDINLDGGVDVLGDAFVLIGNLGESNAP